MFDVLWMSVAWLGKQTTNNKCSQAGRTENREKSKVHELIVELASENRFMEKSIMYIYLMNDYLRIDSVFKSQCAKKARDLNGMYLYLCQLNLNWKQKWFGWPLVVNLVAVNMIIELKTKAVLRLIERSTHKFKVSFGANLCQRILICFIAFWSQMIWIVCLERIVEIMGWNGVD